MTVEPLWLFADQLGPHVHATDEHRDREVVLIESTRVLHRKRFHRQKLQIVWSGMRHLAAELGDRATLLQTGTYREALEQVGRPVVVHEPTSHAALAFVEQLREEGVVAEILPTPTFALPRAEFEEWAGDRETFRMEEFYRSQRRRFDILMEGGEPVGGRWNYDHENREPPPKGRATLGVVAPWQPSEDEIDERVRADLDALDLPTIGRDGPRWFAVTADEARRALAHFVHHRLPHFGPSEDAMLQGVRDRGWTHHIQRLVVLGNHALQRGYHPRALSDRFREAFVDGFEWVMPTNVIGMSQHADGGLLATKPYAAGGAYINRMSDHCRTCAFDPRKRLGDDACPYTAGYWAWVHRHRALLGANNRTQRAVASMERLADLDAVLEQEAAREAY